MQRLLARLKAAVVFPGQLRVVTLADDAESIAVAAGAALAEAPRGGVVVAVVGSDPAVAPALATAVALGAPLLVLVSGSGADLARYAAAGWDVATTDLALPVTRPTVCAAEVVPAPRTAATAWEWPPVRLPTLDAWRLTPHRDLDAALGDLAAREARIRLVHATPPWSSAPVSSATLVAAAAHAGEGRRMVWRLPAGVDLLGWLPALRMIGARQLPVTLLCAAADAPALAHWRALPGWWVAAPGDLGETVAVLARALSSDDCVAVLLPAAAKSDTVPPWPAGEAHEPGAGRWLASEATPRATIVCAADGALAALAARAALATVAIPVAVLQCTSLHPLPVGDLLAAAAQGPLVVVDAGAGSSGLAAAVAVEAPGVAWVGIDAWGGVAPTAADIAAAVRTVLVS